jgi:myo-inositol-1(or 4)-monophosphatase
MDDAMSDRHLSVAVAAATQAGKLLLEEQGKTRRVTQKGEVDLVTEMDWRAEALIVDTLRSAFPDHSVLGEEGTRVEGSAPYRWLIDPLDGTTNYTHGFPVFCVSIGLELAGMPVLGVVCDPVRGELFVAERGRGARLNRDSIRVSGSPTLNESLLATGFPYDIRENPRNNLAEYSAFSLRCRGVRRLGSAALDLCYVAAGRLDGFWELRLGPWDMAAGALMVEEAGGRVTDLEGEPFALDKRQIVASNGRVHAEMIRVLQAVTRRTRVAGQSA